MCGVQLTRVRGPKGRFTKLGLGEPSAADLDRDSEEKQAKVDTTVDTEEDLEKEKAIAKWEEQKIRMAIPNNSVANAMIASSFAVMVVLATLWGCYYILRPKLDRPVANVTCYPAPTPSSTPTNEGPGFTNEGQGFAGITLGNGNVWLPKDSDAQNNGKGEPYSTWTNPTPRPGAVYAGDLRVEAKEEDVWIKVILDDANVMEGILKKGRAFTQGMSAEDKLTVISGKPGALRFFAQERFLAVTNQATHPDKVGLYIFDGKQLFAQKGGAN